MLPGLKIGNVYVEDYHRTGPAYEYYGEDGPVELPPQHIYVIYVETLRGELFMHTQHFAFTPEGKAEAEAMAAQVRAHGIIAFFDETWAACGMSTDTRGGRMSKRREVRVTIEVLDTAGEVTASEVVLVDAVGGELEDGGLGDIETAINEVLSRFEEGA